MHNRYFIILTGLLLIVGGLLVLQHFSAGDTTFADQESYERARGAGDVPEGAPALPPCAEHIAVSSSRAGVESITFSCADAAERDAFVSELKRGFDWNVLIFDGGRVSLTPANPY